MPLSPGRILPRDMDARQWETFVSQSGVQADRTIKTFQPIWTGFSADPVGDLSYYDFGKIVAVWNDSNSQLVGTSSAITLSFSGLPENIRPDNTAIIPVFAVDNGNTIAAAASVTQSGQVQISVVSVSGSYLVVGGATSFTPTGSKGLPPGWIIMYAK